MALFRLFQLQQQTELVELANSILIEISVSMMMVMVMMIMMVMMMTMTRSELCLLGRGGWEPSTVGTSLQAAGTFSLM